MRGGSLLFLLLKETGILGGFLSDKSAVLVCFLEVYPLMHCVQDVVVLMHFSFPESVTCLFPILSRQL